MTFELVYQGAEIGSNRKLLEAAGITNMGVSFRTAQKRGLPVTKHFSDRFSDDSNIWLEAGTIDPESTVGDIEDYAADYQEFIVDNRDKLYAVIEMDAPAMGKKWVEEQRTTFYDEVLGDDVFIPFWDPHFGHQELELLAERYARVAIPGSVLETDHSLAARVRLLINSHSTEFHALSLSSPEKLRQVPFSSASSMAWLSPMRNGETIVWNGREIQRYPKSKKDQARRANKSVFEKAGFDYDKISADDRDEVTAVAIWSYEHFAANIDSRRGNPFQVISGEGNDAEVVAISDWQDSGENTQTPEGTVATKPERMHNEVIERPDDEMQNMPVMGFGIERLNEFGEGGQSQRRDIVVTRPIDKSVRQCNNCYLSDVCPAFKPNTSCAFRFPVELRTPEQHKAFRESLLEMQATRVGFAKFAEELKGGYPDPNLSAEMDRYMKMAKQNASIHADDNSFIIKGTGSAGVAASAGALSAIFGEGAAKKLQPAPVPVEIADSWVVGEIEGPPDSNS